MSAASAAGVFAEGSRFGAYVIGPCIGHGGMARIYRAEHERLERQVALKVLTGGVGNDSEGRARFLREARIAAAIKHPNVVNIYDVGVERHVPYMVMELLVGHDLETLLHTRGAIDEETLVALMVPVVAGLVAVHDAGVVHRDLKPGNIFLARNASDEIEPKLLDFGISKAADASSVDLTFASRSHLLGTPVYMAPEALGGAELDALSDQYSLGVVLYECATGINPFEAGSIAATLRRVVTGEYTPLSQQAVRPSKRLASIIQRALSLDPKRRFPDLRALGRELLALADERTRILWELTFGEVAAAARARHVLAIERLQPAELAAPRPPTERRRADRDDSVRWVTLGLIGAGSLALAGWLALHDPQPARSPWYEPGSETAQQQLQPAGGREPRTRDGAQAPPDLYRASTALYGDQARIERVLANPRSPAGAEDSPSNDFGPPPPQSSTNAAANGATEEEAAEPPAPAPSPAPRRYRPPPEKDVPIGTNGAPIFH